LYVNFASQSSSVEPFALVIAAPVIGATVAPGELKMEVDNNQIDDRMDQNEQEETDIGDGDIADAQQLSVEPRAIDDDLEQSSGEAEEEQPVDDDQQPTKVDMSAQVYRRIAECLTIELASIERQIARAEEISVRDGFFTRWKTILDLKHRQCATALERAKQSAVELSALELAR
jgi:hypothetical protein